MRNPPLARYGVKPSSKDPVERSQDQQIVNDKIAQLNRAPYAERLNILLTMVKVVKKHPEYMNIFRKIVTQGHFLLELEAVSKQTRALRNPSDRKAYFCTICNRTHNVESKLGRLHYQTMQDTLSKPSDRKDLTPEEAKEWLYHVLGYKNPIIAKMVRPQAPQTCDFCPTPIKAGEFAIVDKGMCAHGHCFQTHVMGWKGVPKDWVKPERKLARNPQRRHPTSVDKDELIDLYHLARVPGKSSRYDRMIWATDQFVKLHPEWTRASAYKAMDEALQHSVINPIDSSLYRSFHGTEPKGVRKVYYSPPEGVLTKIGDLTELKYIPSAPSKYAGTEFVHASGDTGEAVLKTNCILATDKSGENIYLVKDKPIKRPYFSGRGIIG